MVKEPNAVWHNSGRKDCLVFIGYQYEMPFAAHGLRLRLKALAIDQLNREAAAGVLPAAAGVMAAKTALKIVGPAGVEAPVTAAQHAAGNLHRAKPCYDQ